jgi:hypothetical protein
MDALLDKLTPLFEQAYANGKDDGRAEERRNP